MSFRNLVWSTVLGALTTTQGLLRDNEFLSSGDKIALIKSWFLLVGNDDQALFHLFGLLVAVLAVISFTVLMIKTIRFMGVLTYLLLTKKLPDFDTSMPHIQ